MKKILLPLSIITVIAAGITYFYIRAKNEPIETVPAPVVTVPVPEEVVQEKPKTNFTLVTIQSDIPGKELSELVGFANIPSVLALNRLDDKHLYKGMELVIPTSFENTDWEYMPAKISNASDIPKLAIIAQKTQSVGFYENGVLVRSGPVSSGKKSTPTPSGLYFTNWKGKEVKSTFDDEWILKWNFNLDNNEGIAMHQYALPGYPASHSCVRMYEETAMWFYDWADQWVLDATGYKKLASGTPVIIYGEYDFAKKAPWKRLPTDEKATITTETELEKIVEQYHEKIISEKENRTIVVAQKTTSN